jgi:dTDP-4-dehydrorhamnose reductase
MDTVLITGMSGFMGWNLARSLRSNFRVYGTYLDNPVDVESCESVAFDLTELASIQRLCSAIHPKAIVHTAAISSPDRCETERKLALTLNTFATRELAKSACQLGCKLIYLSSDLLFDGVKGMYTEADMPAPLNYYAKTKYLGELEITNNCGNYATVRMSLLYGRGNGNNKSCLEDMEQKARQGEELRLYTDQYRTPLFAGDAVTAILQLIMDREARGLFHLGGPTKLSRFEFGEYFCQAFSYSSRLLVPCRMEESRQTTRRPRDCSLSSVKAQKALKLSLTPPRQGLDLLRHPEGEKVLLD